MFNNLGHLFTYKTGPQKFYQKCFKHDIICIIDDNNLIHNINNYNNLQFCLRRLAVNKMATNIWRYFTLGMRDYPWHISIRLANIYSILSSINIYPLINTVLKIAENVSCFPILVKNVAFYKLKVSWVFFSNLGDVAFNFMTSRTSQ